MLSEHLHDLTLEIVETLESDHNKCRYLVFHFKCGYVYKYLGGDI